MKSRTEYGRYVGVPAEAWQYKPTTPPVNENLRRLQNVVSLRVELESSVRGPDEQPTGLESVDFERILEIEGETVLETVADTNVPVPENYVENIEGGDFAEEEGFTNEEAGIAD